MLRRAHRCRSKGQRPPTASKRQRAYAEYRKSKSKPNSVCAGMVNGAIPSQPESGPRYPDFATPGTCRYWSQASSSPTLRSLWHGK